MSGRVSLWLLGTFRAELDNRALRAFESDKVRALLAYLALRAGHGERRERLCALFWPDLPRARARHNLNQALSSLRTLFGDRDAERPILVTDRQTVLVDDEVLAVDALLFDRLLARCQKPDASPEQQMAWRRQAQRLYQGDFLAGLTVEGSAEFDEWVALQRERRHLAAVDALGWLADIHEARAELAQAERYARRQTELEPWREEAHSQLMRLLAHQGRRSAALAQYERCCQALEETFGVVPTAATTALYRHIAQTRESRLVSLPPEGKQFVGRRRELAQLSALLAQPEQRLLSLIGPGGSGKTSLAVALAHRVQERFLDGAVAVLLVGRGTREEMLSALVTALGLSEGEANLLARAQDYLRDKELLLLLDNCEQVVGAGEVARELLAAAPALKIVATSRHALRLREERRFPLAGLAVAADEDGEELPEAARLFLQAARRVRPDFSPSPDARAAIVDICHLVEGLPLAVELAASWIHATTTGELAAKIRGSLDFLVTGASDMPGRHASLRAVWDHSWSLLSTVEQGALSRLTIFPGAFSREAIREITAVPLHILASLVDKSLLQPEYQGRYRLHALVREYAASTLEAAEQQALLDAHSAYYLALLAGARDRLYGREAAQARAALRPELNNLRLAWETAVASGHWARVARTADALAAFYTLEGVPSLACESFQAAADVLAATPQAPADLGALLWAHQSRFLLKLGDSEEATAAARRALELAPDEQAAAAAQLALGWALELRGQHAEAETAFEHALLLGRRLDDARTVAHALNGRGNVHWRRAAYEAAIEEFHQALHLDRETGYVAGVIDQLSNLGIVYREVARFPEAMAALEEALELAETLSHREAVGRAANNLGLVFWQMGRREAALDAYRRAYAIAEELGIRRGILVTVSNIGVINRELGDYEAALGCYRHAVALARELDFKNPLAVTLGNIANIYRDMGRYREAWPYYEEAVALDEALGNKEGVGRHWGEMGQWFALQGKEEAARAYLEMAADRLRELGVPYYLSTVLPALADVCLCRGDLEAAAAYNEEGERVAGAVGRAEAMVQVALVAARLAAARGDLEAARARLEPLAESIEEAVGRAAVSFTLWQLTGDREWGGRALVLYRELSAKTPNAAYRERRERLAAALAE